MARDWNAVAQKWKTNTTSPAAQKNWVDGIQRMTENPAQKAIAAIPKYLMNVQQAVESGRMAQSLGSVSLQYIQQQAQAKQGNFGRGAGAAFDKVLAFHTSFGPMQQAAADAVNRMPKLTIEDSKAKSAAMIDAAHALKGRWRGR